MITRAEFFANMERHRDDGGDDWQDRAEKRWAARERAADWFNQPLPTGCAFVWRSHQEPEVFRTWDLYSLDDYDYVAAFPSGDVHLWADSGQGFGCFAVESVDLPNGWTLVVGYHS